MELLTRNEQKTLKKIQEKSNDEYLNAYIQYIRACKISDISFEFKHAPSLLAGFFSLHGISIAYNVNLLQNIPQTGPIIFVANHSSGYLDSFVLYSLLQQIRPDIKIAEKIEIQTEEILSTIFFQPIIQSKSAHPHTEQQIFEFIQSGKSLLFFPQNDKYDIHDSKWDETQIAFLQKIGAPIIPIYIRTEPQQFTLQKNKIKIPFFSKKNYTVNIFVSIGNIITKKEQKAFDKIDVFTRYVRACTYMLKHEKAEVKQYFQSVMNISRPRKEEPLAPSIDTELIQKEIEAISSQKLFSFKQFDVFCAPAVRIPLIMMELGRLREYTFRQIGEGTLRSIDIDEYDLYYEQLFIWDKEEKKIVGAYRLGFGTEILQQFGKKGFYIHSLFKIKDDAIPLLQKSIELGRSFINPEYQKHPYSLFLLWRGIVFMLLHHTQYRYLIGPVSISNEFSKISKSLIVSFIQSHHFNHELARFFKPRKKFTIPKEIINCLKCSKFKV